MGHDAKRAQFQVPHGPGGERHHLRLQRQAPPVQRTRQRHAGCVQHLRSLQIFHPLPENPFKGKCAVVTSYNPQARDVTLEETGANTETDKQFIYNTYNELLKDVEARPT
jgi:hypothetical protein